MSFYPWIIFVHVLGAVGIFAAMGMEVVSLATLRRAETLADVRVWLTGSALPARLGPLAMVSTLVSGIWMMAATWGRQPWLLAAVVGLVGMAVLGGAVTFRRKRLRLALAAKPPVPFPSPRSAAALTAASLRLRIAVGVGILGLMTIKPGPAGAWLILATVVAGGLVASVRPLAAIRTRPTITNQA